MRPLSDVPVRMRSGGRNKNKWCWRAQWQEQGALVFLVYLSTCLPPGLMKPSNCWVGGSCVSSGAKAQIFINFQLEGKNCCFGGVFLLHVSRLGCFWIVQSHHDLFDWRSWWFDRTWVSPRCGQDRQRGRHKPFMTNTTQQGKLYKVANWHCPLTRIAVSDPRPPFLHSSELI